MNAPRITYVITDLHTGGVPLHLLRLATGVRDRGYDPSVISLAPGGAVAEQLRSRDIPVYSCDAGGARDLPAIWRLAQHLRRLQPDVVHAFLFHANVASRFAIRLAGVSPRRLVCEIQTVEVERRWHLWVGGLTHAMGYCVVGNSPSVVEHLERRAHMSPERLRCIPGGVDVDRIDDAVATKRSDIAIPEGRSIVLWVGRLDPVKGLKTLIDAFATVVSECDASLVLVGDGDDEQTVRRSVERNRLGDRVHLLGRRDDVAGLLKLADVFVLPSLTEGMPNALLEAMAAGRAVVTTDVPGCRDLVTHEQTGLVVEPGNAAQLSAAIVRLLRDRGLADRLGRCAEKHVRSDYSLNRCIDRYVALYREVTSEVP